MKLVNVLFFGQTRELIGLEQLEIENEEFKTAEQLRQFLYNKGGKWALALATERLLVAINQRLSSLESTIKNGDEVAFFPPVTGG